MSSERTTIRRVAELIDRFGDSDRGCVGGEADYWDGVVDPRE
jgi:hypothetical protein